ncbi:MAG: 4-hydroxy-tetrahydrodipicolinate synthase [Bacteroidetes bacterium]|nr:4-hydroxy-tetrahydrodipicolinate synthase [Bacteroidota bacterium]
MVNEIRGTGVALITPFHNYGTIDFTSLGKIIEHVIENQVDFIVALGTTSEAATLSKDEKQAVMEYIIESVDGRVPIVMGIGGNNTQEITDNIKSQDFTGIAAVLSVTPYYNKPQQKGLYYHFKNITTACPVPIILYNVPGRTAANLTAETTLRLAFEFETIIGVKEASGNFQQIMEIIRDKPKEFVVYSGDDALTFPLLMLGAEGVISVVANAFPREFSFMVTNAIRGSKKKARAVHYALLDIMNAIFEDGNPSGIKAALDIMGMCGNNLRLPLVKVNKATYNKLQTLVEMHSLPALIDL